MANLAIIPARGGSKRIPGKNTKHFLGKPIISYSINAAKNSGLFEEIMVSTDSDDIASLAVSEGIKVPFKRSVRNADDHATLTDVVKEVIDEYKNVGRHFDFICMILPTAVFCSSGLLVNAYDRMQGKEVSGVVPVVKYGHPVQRAFQMDENNELKMLFPDNINTRTQDLPPAYYDSGQFYWIRTSDFGREKKIFMKHMVAIEIPESEVQDIDTEDDWKIAEVKYSLLHSKIDT
jgi:N-acylneuraminate cytidylyltransferase